MIESESQRRADHHTMQARKVLVTGATGYIGGRLVPRLLDAGIEVRCLARSPEKLAARKWAERAGVEVVAGDASDAMAVTAAMRGCSAAYYLIHSMEVAGSEYAERDRVLARTFAECAAQAGIERIVYLGGLGETGDGLSRHLSSRREVEELLGSTRVPVTVLRAAMIIGSGSASFEILRYLVERLPVMVTPRWVSTRCQPIGVDNVLRYLIGCLEAPESVGATLDIGGPDVLTYRELMDVVAQQRGLRRRWIVPVPVLTPRLSSLWIHLVTPIGKEIARPLAEGLRNEVVCRDARATEVVPQTLDPVRRTIELALADEVAETTWTDAGAIAGDPDWAGGSIFRDAWSVDIAATPEQVFEAVCRVGGGHGWYAARWLWVLRGWLDRLVGGPGLRRGRRDPRELGHGDALDFWRVTEVVVARRLALRAEMKLPGEARLAFDVIAGTGHAGTTSLVQVAQFAPRGLLGLAYWYAVVPLHGLVFKGMLSGIRRAAEELSGRTSEPRPPVRRHRDSLT